MGFCGIAGHSGKEAGVAKVLEALAHGAESKDSALLHVGIRFAAIDQATLWKSDSTPFPVLAALDGSLFDRDELSRQLGVDGNACTDAELAGRAYQQWGAEFAAYLDGEFACAVWDASERRLLLCRDVSGRRALYYTRNKPFRFATQMAGLLAWSDVSREIDAGHLVCWLSRQPAQSTTFFREIAAVPLGDVVSVQDEAVTARRYWHPLEMEPLHFSSDAAYEELIRETLTEAVHRRIPKEGLVSTHLSGGLDSGSITSLAAEELQRQGRSLLAMTAVPERVLPSYTTSGRFMDEREHAAAVVSRHPNIEHVLVANDGAALWESVDYFGRMGIPLLNLKNVRWLYAQDLMAAQWGSRQCLKGTAGNLTLSHSSWWGLRELWGDWPELYGAVRRRKAAGQTWKSILWQMLAADARRMYLLRRVRGASIETLYDQTSLKPSFVEQAGYGGAFERWGRLSHAFPGKNIRASRLRFTQLQDMGAYTPETERVFGMTVSDPMQDRRVVELVLRIPTERFWVDGVPRQLFRNAMRGVLPEKILAERRRGLQGSDWHAVMSRDLPLYREEIDAMKRSAFVREAIDVVAMEQTLKEWPSKAPTDMKWELKLGRIGSALTAGRFIRQIEEREIF